MPRSDHVVLPGLAVALRRENPTLQGRASLGSAQLPPNRRPACLSRRSPLAWPTASPPGRTRSASARAPNRVRNCTSAAFSCVGFTNTSIALSPSSRTVPRISTPWALKDGRSSRRATCADTRSRRAYFASSMESRPPSGTRAASEAFSASLGGTVKARWIRPAGKSMRAPAKVSDSAASCPAMPPATSVRSRLRASSLASSAVIGIRCRSTVRPSFLCVRVRPRRGQPSRRAHADPSHAAPQRSEVAPPSRRILLLCSPFALSRRSKPRPATTQPPCSWR